jgi:polar amino acid transport system substrate-binding protein
MSAGNKSLLLLFFRKEERIFFLKRKKQRTFIPAVVAACVLCFGVARADTLSVCIDSASATADRDQKIAEAVAKREGATLAVQHFDGANGDDGVTDKQFKKLLSTKCQLVMGYPVDASDTTSPPDILETKSYDETGFVLVVPKGSPARSLADLPAGTQVAVTFETAPNLYFLQHKNVTPDVHETDTETLKALVDGHVKAAMVWQPTVQTYLESIPSANLAVYPLTEPHARWNVVALYTAQSAAAAKRFETEVAALQGGNRATFNPAMVHKQSSTGFDPALVIRAAVGDAGNEPPALYTAAQAQAGAQHYAALCAVCHGAQLQGVVGPALKGPNFASAKAGFAVGDIFTIIANNMPASDPGSLAPDVYVKVMAYVLQQNGYPAGNTPLTYNMAAASNVKLIYRGQ